MPFIAQCPFCHAKVRVPDDSAGMSVNCPRCGDCFTLARMENPPEVKESNLRPPAASAAAAAVLATVRAEEEQAAATAAAAAAKPGSPPTPARPPAEPWREPRTFPYELLGPVALVLGAIGMACAPIPGSQTVVLVLAGLASAIGLAGWIAAAKPDRGGRSKPALGFFLGCTLGVVTLLWPNLLGGGPPFGDNTPRPFGHDVPDPGSNVETAAPIAGTTGLSAVHVGTIDVRIVRAEAGPIRFADAAGANERGLQITVRIFNSSKVQPLPYYGWSGPMPGNTVPSAVLRGNDGKTYALRSFGPEREVKGQVRRTTVTPAGQIDDLLVFETPTTAVNMYTLELPLAAIGGTGTLRVGIPGSAVTTR